MVHAALTKPLDWCSIRLARRTVHRRSRRTAPVVAAETLLADPDFFCRSDAAPPAVTFLEGDAFRFPTAMASPWTENNTVFGRLFRCAPDWARHPTVILVHGWNAEKGYRLLFPWLARRLVRAGVNAAMIELPYHSQRKPRQAGAVTNFLSDDPAQVLAATRQAIADTRTLAGWLVAQGCQRVGLWGISLGAWLSGLLACTDDRLDFAVLMIPVSRIDRVITELDFCAPLRHRLEVGQASSLSSGAGAGQAASLSSLNLTAHRPRLAPERILIVASAHDLFAPAETIEELWQSWGRPEIWRTRHGHISMLMSAPVMGRTIHWIATQTTAASAN